MFAIVFSFVLLWQGGKCFRHHSVFKFYAGEQLLNSFGNNRLRLKITMSRYRYDCKITYLSVHLEHKFYECSSIFVIERIRVNTPFLTL